MPHGVVALRHVQSDVSELNWSDMVWKFWANWPMSKQ